MNNTQSAAFLGNCAWESDYQQRGDALIADIKRGGFTGGLLGIYRDDHRSGWQLYLLYEILHQTNCKDIVLRLNGKLPEVEETEDWLQGFYAVLDDAYQWGVRLIQFSNEPNNPDTAEPFDTYRPKWLKVRDLLKARYPECKCLNPGYVPNVREEDWVRLLLNDADGLALHVKWENDNWQVFDWGGSYRWLHEMAPEKDIYITEYGQTNSSPNRTQNCINWLKALRYEPYVKLACYFGVGMVGWDTENATPELLEGLAAVKPLTELPTDVENYSENYYEGETTMAFDRHAEFDAWQKALGGVGYNPKDAFGKIISDNPDKQYGVFVGPYHFAEDLILAWTTVGIFWFRKSTNVAGFATAEEELPF